MTSLLCCFRLVIFCGLFMVFSTAHAFTQDDNAYCLPGDIPNFGAIKDGPANLPKACYYTALSAPPSNGNKIPVPPGTNTIQPLFNNGTVQCGDTLILQAGQTYTGTVTLPALNCH